jgi:hypothetical protein
MEDLQKEFVPYELAVKLKAIGFKERVLTYYEDGKPKLHNDITGWDFNSSFLNCVSRPTFSQAFRWFREKYDLPSWTYESEGKWFWKIVKGDFWEQDKKPYIYEEAELACLEKLIEIVESKSE